MVDVEEHNIDVAKLGSDIYDLIMDESEKIKGGVSVLEIISILELLKHRLILDTMPKNDKPITGIAIVGGYPPGMTLSKD